jgi:hypothetical protein
MSVVISPGDTPSLPALTRERERAREREREVIRNYSTTPHRMIHAVREKPLFEIAIFSMLHVKVQCQRGSCLDRNRACVLRHLGIWPGTEQL